MSICKSENDCDEHYLRQHLERYAKEAQINNAKFKIEKCCDKGDNFVGLVYRIVIEGDKKDNPETVNAILKVASIIEERRIQVPTLRTFFLQEILFFKEVWPIFQDLDLIIKHIPKLLYANDGVKNEALLLEDMNIQGFVSMKQTEGISKRESKFMNYEHVALALRCLGRFHAGSFIIRHRKPETFNILKNIIEEPLFRKNFRNNNGRTTMLFDIVKTVFAEDDEKYKKKLNDFSETFFDHVDYVIDGKNAEPYAVICHGDFWSNNMLYRYEEDSLEPKDFCFLDFQMCRYGSVALDIMYVLLCCCKPEMRRESYDLLLKKYHDSLSECLRESGMDPLKLFPYEQLMQQIQRFGKYAGIMGLYVTHLFTAGEEDEVPDIGGATNDRLLMENFLNTNSFYKRIIKGIFKDLIDQNYI